MASFTVRQMDQLLAGVTSHSVSFCIIIFCCMDGAFFCMNVVGAVMDPSGHGGDLNGAALISSYSRWSHQKMGPYGNYMNDNHDLFP